MEPADSCLGVFGDEKLTLKKMKSLLLKFTKQNSKQYWDLRWQLGYDSDHGVDGCREIYKTDARAKWFSELQKLMAVHGCSSVLDVACGKAWLRELDGYLGMDWSAEVLKQTNLPCYLVGNAADHIPLPSKSFDAVTSFFFLMHQPNKEAECSSREMMRVAKKLIVLREEQSGSERHGCYTRDYEELFKEFDGKLVMLQWE